MTLTLDVRKCVLNLAHRQVENPKLKGWRQYKCPNVSHRNITLGFARYVRSFETDLQTKYVNGKNDCVHLPKQITNM